MQFELVYCVWLQLQNSLSHVGIIHPLSWNSHRFPKRRQNVHSHIWHLVAAATSCVTEKSSWCHNSCQRCFLGIKGWYKVSTEGHQASRPGGKAAPGPRIRTQFFHVLQYFWNKSEPPPRHSAQLFSTEASSGSFVPRGSDALPC